MAVILNSVRAFMGATIEAQASHAPARFGDAVQVRTSALAILATSVVPAAAYAIVAVPLVAMLFSTWQPTDWSTQILRLGISSALFVITAVTTMLPFSLVVAITHTLARSLRRRRDVDYAAIGAVVSLVAAPTMYVYLPVTMPLPTLVLAGALTGATYRRLAGMERLAQTAAVWAADPGRAVDRHHLVRATASQANAHG
jgi:hypothetical protein